MKKTFTSRAGILRALSLVLLLSLLAPLLLSCSAGSERETVEGESSGTGDLPTSGELTRRVALTFDDGPHNTRTPAIVDELEKYGFHATFFVVGNRVDGSAYSGGSAMLYAIEGGNEIGIHGYTHEAYYDRCSDKVFAEEMTNTKQAIRGNAKGYKISLMRPVGGYIKDERVENCPYSVVLWDVDSEDWRYKYASGDSDAVRREKVDTIVNNVLEDVKDGSIILMHDIYESTLDAVVVLLERLHEMGYEVVTVSELLGDQREKGRLYEHGRD